MPLTYGDEETTLFFDPDAAPIAYLDDGQTVVAHTADSLCGLWKRVPSDGMHIDEVVDELGGACPLTGPFAVRGAEPGSVLEVELHRVEPKAAEGTAWTGLFRGFGALSTDVYGLQPDLEAGVVEVPYRDGRAHLPVGEHTIEIPIRPFLGTVGVAPVRERRMSFSQSPEYLGDVDQPGVTAGATLVLPVNAPGGLLSLGDAHAAQGDGEITGVAVEIEAEVEFTVRVADRDAAHYVALPQLNTSTSIGSIAGLQGTNLGDVARAAYTDLARRLTRSHGLAVLDAYRLLGQVGRLQIGNMIDPFYSVMASIDLEYLP
ncbi:MAG: acetamidase/formamidase family protein [Acidimicrobiia bacterium]|nr:acetamidase/formamidase family protein [Acidimicrobiia bacterium]